MRKMMTLIPLFLFFSCESPTESKYNPPASHTINKDGVMHKSGLTTPAANCASCHGSDLRGGDSGVSCYECHGKKW